MEQEPTVRASIGDSVAAVVRASSVDLAGKVRPSEPKDLVVVTTPATLVYGGGDRPVRLGAGRYLALAVDAGHVTGVTASPHLRALTLDEVVEAAADVSERLRAAGWSGAAAATPEATRAAARGDTTGFFRADLGRWTAGGDRAVVRVRQIADATTDAVPEGAPGAGPPSARRYVLSVEFENPEVARRFGESAVQAIERQRVSGTPD